MQWIQRQATGWMVILLSGITTSSTGVAHPTAHVDAWLKTGDTLDVRIVVVLHDVLRYQGIEADDNAVIPADQVTSALETFGTTLLKRLQVYDGSGYRLNGVVRDLPRWTPDSDGVRMSSNSALRLTWRLGYDWNPDDHSLSVRHRFEPHTDPNDENTNAATCELRLHVLHKPTGRRIDSVVPPDRFHTLLFDNVNQNASAGSTTVRSSADVFLTLTPGRLTHEFAMPLSDLEDLAWSGTRIHDDRTETHPQVRTSESLEQIHAWTKKHLRLSVDGRPNPSLSWNVALLSPQGEVITESCSIPLVGTRVGIRTVHATPSTPQSFTAQWNNGLGGATSVTQHILTPIGSQSRIVALKTDNAPTIAYTWLRSDGDMRLATSQSDCPRSFGPPAVMQGIWKDQSLAGPDRTMIAGALSLILLGAVAISRPRRRAWTFSGALFLLAGIATAAVAWKNVSAAAVPNTAGLQPQVQRMLNQVYACVTQPDEDAIVDGLSDVLTPDMTERLFLGIVGSVISPVDEGPLIQIDAVEVTDCRLKEWHSEKWLTADCAWTVAGRILHWGHLHEREIRMEAAVRLESTGGSPRIAGITVKDIQTLGNDEDI